MFTGLVRAIGMVVEVDATPRARGGATPAHRLRVDFGGWEPVLEPGASVAINGSCLTLVEQSGSIGAFDIVPETWARTTLSDLSAGDRVNMEPSLRAGDPLDGHFVQGHVDGVGTVARVEKGTAGWKLWVRVPAALMPYVVVKGSIALDGTSLTVVDVEGDTFSVALIPTTLDDTTLRSKRPGKHINVETDILARLIVQRLAAIVPGVAAATDGEGLSIDKLRAGGFIQ